jgi:hypothetical protein
LRHFNGEGIQTVPPYTAPDLSYVIKYIFGHEIFISHHISKMRPQREIMPERNALSTLQLRQLLIDIKENAPNVCVRFRLIGEMWQEQMMRVVVVSDERVLLLNETENKLVSITIQHVMQFEVDNKFKILEPYNHYDIIVGDMFLV